MFLKTILPFVGYPIYLFAGIDDGVHIYPYSKLYSNTSNKEKIKCVVSSMVVFINLYFLINLYGSVSTFLKFYGGAYIIFAFCLYMVTYMQHHKYETKVYDDTTWSYLNGALETVDRTYGYGIDDIQHNISDCHVAHHLFFTQIPHYNLKTATEKIRPLLISHNRYNYENHKNILYDFFKLFVKVNMYKWRLYTKSETKEN